MTRIKTRRQSRERRHLRLRKKVQGPAERPRLAVFRSLKHIYAQIIDDSEGITLAFASTRESEFSKTQEELNKSELSKKIGANIAKRAKEKGVTSVVFDRGGFKYHGRVKALAEAARQEGLIF